MNVNPDLEAAPEVMTVRQTATLLAVSMDVIYSAVRLEQLSAVRIRGRIFITKPGVRAFLKGVPVS